MIHEVQIVSDESWATIKPKIVDFTARPFYPSRIKIIRLQQLKDRISLPAAISQRIEKESERLNKTCAHFVPHMSDTLIPRYYPYASRFIILAERQLKSSDYAQQYAEHWGINVENTEEIKAYFDELSALLIKDSSGFTLVERIAYDPTHIDIRKECLGSDVINEVIGYGAERYKFIYNTVVGPEGIEPSS